MELDGRELEPPVPMIPVPVPMIPVPLGKKPEPVEPALRVTFLLLVGKLRLLPVGRGVKLVTDVLALIVILPVGKAGSPGQVKKLE